MAPTQEVIWASFFGRRYLASVRSVAMPFSLVLGAGGPLALHYYFDVVGNYNGAFAAFAALALLAALLILSVRRPTIRGLADDGTTPPSNGGRPAGPPDRARRTLAAACGTRRRWR